MKKRKKFKERKYKDSERGIESMRKEIDFLAIIFFVMAGFFFYNHNNIGWVFLLLGILKYFLDKDYIMKKSNSQENNNLKL